MELKQTVLGPAGARGVRVVLAVLVALHLEQELVRSPMVRSMQIVLVGAVVLNRRLVGITRVRRCWLGAHGQFAAQSVVLACRRETESAAIRNSVTLRVSVWILVTTRLVTNSDNAPTRVVSATGVRGASVTPNAVEASRNESEFVSLHLFHALGRPKPVNFVTLNFVRVGAIMS